MNYILAIATRSALVAALLVCLLPVPSASNPSISKETAEEHLARAFDLRFNFDIVQIIRLSIQTQTGTRDRTIEMATKRIDGRLHSLGTFTEPGYLRGTNLLLIENKDRSDDFFIYMPSQNKVRRITSAQRADSFMGTDLSYEDLERRYVSDYAVRPLEDDSIHGEPVYVVEATPKYDSGYLRAIFYIAKTDHAILEVRYFCIGHATACKVQHVPRSEIVVIEGHLIPKHIEVRNPIRHTTTTVDFGRIQVNPTLEDSLFSAAMLENSHDIPHLRSSLPKSSGTP